MGCNCFSKEGYEADDVMASLGVWARQRGLHVVHVSHDKDMLQLISPGTHVMHPRTLQILGVDEVRGKFGVSPTQLVDLLALMGDSAVSLSLSLGQCD